MTPGLTFAIATRDELRLRGRLVEQRLAHGIARHRGTTIEADDTRDDELVMRCDAAIDDLRAAAPSDARVRLLASARRIADTTIVSATMTIGVDGLFVVSDADHSWTDVAFLRSLHGADSRATAPRDLPIVWLRGSAAVLLHEAAGHPAEHRHAPVSWPSWLSVRDEPSFAVDDLGAKTRAVDLLAGEPPACHRRESFRDVPMRRMTQLVARGHAPFAMPERRIEIQLLAGGAYEPLDESVTIRVAAADLVEGETRQRLDPFTMRESRAAIARSIVGAIGEPLRYPGVVCSSEGQELIVGSRAPVMLTRFA